MAPIDQIRSPSWLFMGPREGLRKRRTLAPGSISEDSLLNVSDDEPPTDASTPYRVSEDGPILHSLLPKMSPKKMETASLGDSGFQDMPPSSEKASPEEASSEVLFERKDTEPSSRTGRLLPLWVIVAMVVFGAIGFGLMMSSKEDVEVEQLNGKYKSIQFAREKMKSVDYEDIYVFGETLLDYSDDKGDDGVDPLSPDYPDDPQFRKFNLAKNNQVEEGEHIEEDKVVEYVLKNRRGASDTQGGYRLPLLILVFPFLILAVKLVRLGSGM